ncbi:tetratricopeptide repeat protein [Kitasatospora purpeofusca]|uniref:tetratricopeptide repeat protein n=1 Tax=Kitasatospora purpeofusca TaxID=67352 RepID=UPI0035D81AD4
MLTSAHVTGPVGTRVKVFHPAGSGTAQGRVVWSGTPGGRDDAALVLVHDSDHWRPPTTPVRWGRAVTDRPGTPCETWGAPDVAQRPGRAVEAEQLRGQLNPGTGFVGNQHVIDLDQPAPVWRAEDTSPFAGLSGAAVFCDRLLTGVVAADRAHSAHGRLNAVPAYVLHHDPEFRAALAEWDVGPSGGLQTVEFQDLADRAQDPDRTQRLPSPTALLQARQQIVPFYGRHDLLAELTAWCRLGGFGAWLLHGPGGQGKTRLAHHLAHLLAADGWAVLWPRTTAHAEQLRELRHAAKPLLVVLDYAENRSHQIAALVEAAADHPATTPLKLLLLARTDGDWWQQATTATSLAEDYLTTARTHLLIPLDDTPTNRADKYRDAAQALAGTLLQVDGLPAHDWPALARTLRPPRLDHDAYGNALTLHMTALVDLLDSAEPHPPDQNRPGDRGAVGQEADLVEDRLLTHERRHWRQTVLATAPALSLATLETALAAAHLAGAADREQADRLWQRLPALDGQSRERRDRVTAWLATLYPLPAAMPGGPPWGTFQPDRLAERHIGRVLESDPTLAGHLLMGADATQTAQLLTVYSRAASHPVFHDSLDTQLVALCVRHHLQVTPHVIATATQTNHPQPLIDALNTITTDRTATIDELIGIREHFPNESQRLGPTAAQLAYTISNRYRALAIADPGTFLPGLATSLNNLSNWLGSLGRGEEALAAAQEATVIRRALAVADPLKHFPDFAMALNNLAIRLSRMGRQEESLAAIQEATGQYRTLVQIAPDTYLPDLAMALNNLAIRLGEMERNEEGLAAAEEAVGHYRTLASASPDIHLPDLAMALNNLAVRLRSLGRHEDGLAAFQEAVGHYRALAAANPDIHLNKLAGSLHNLAVQVRDLGKHEEGLAATEEAVGHYRTLASASPDIHLPDLAMALNNRAVQLGVLGRCEESLAAVQEAITICRTVARARPGAHLPDLALGLRIFAIELGEMGRHEEGLAALQESVSRYRVLAAAKPRTYLPYLATTINDLASRLRALGRHEEVLAAIQEAATLSEANPGLLGEAIQQSPAGNKAAHRRMPRQGNAPSE